MRLLTILSLFLLLASCQKKTAPPEEATLKYCAGFPLSGGNIDAHEEYAILEAIIEEYHPNREFIHIHQESQTSWSAEFIFSSMDINGASFDSTTVEEYVLKNDSAYYWKNLFNLPVKFFTEEEYLCLFKGNEYAWESYYAKYSKSGGFLQFARPAIHGNNEAILEYGIHCGYECCAGYIVILEKQNGEWLVKHRIGTWIC
jgi:hypothetical protein